MLISTLHLHELLDNHVHIPDSATHVLDQSHDTCPICAVLFEAVTDAGLSELIILNISDDLPLTGDQVVLFPVVNAKDGRSPPFFG
jgi:hypothetical protein